MKVKEELGALVADSITTNGSGAILASIDRDVRNNMIFALARGVIRVPASETLTSGHYGRAVDISTGTAQLNNHTPGVEESEGVLGVWHIQISSLSGAPTRISYSLAGIEATNVAPSSWNHSGAPNGTSPDTAAHEQENLRAYLFALAGVDAHMDGGNMYIILGEETQGTDSFFSFTDWPDASLTIVQEPENPAEASDPESPNISAGQLILLEETVGGNNAFISVEHVQFFTFPDDVSAGQKVWPGANGQLTTEPHIGFSYGYIMKNSSTPGEPVPVLFQPEYSDVIS